MNDALENNCEEEETIEKLKKANKEYARILLQAAKVIGYEGLRDIYELQKILDERKEKHANSTDEASIFAKEIQNLKSQIKERDGRIEVLEGGLKEAIEALTMTSLIDKSDMSIETRDKLEDLVS